MQNKKVIPPVSPDTFCGLVKGVWTLKGELQLFYNLLKPLDSRWLNTGTIIELLKLHKIIGFM